MSDNLPAREHECYEYAELEEAEYGDRTDRIQESQWWRCTFCGELWKQIYCRNYTELADSIVYDTTTHASGRRWTSSPSAPRSTRHSSSR